MKRLGTFKNVRLCFLPHMPSNIAVRGASTVHRVSLRVSAAAALLQAVLPAASSLHAVSSVHMLSGVPTMSGASDPGPGTAHHPYVAGVPPAPLSAVRAPAASTWARLLSTYVAVLPAAATLRSPTGLYFYIIIL